jgi:hypothetical protein
MSERDHNGARSYPIPVWNGIFDHREKIGPAIWVFLWLIDKITREEAGAGFVLGGSVVRMDTIARELKDSQKTVRRNLETLKKWGYITLKRAPYGFIITVTKSRKFRIWRSDKTVQSGSDKTVREIGQKCPWSDKSVQPADKTVQPSKEDTAVDSAVDSAKRQEPALYWTPKLTPEEEEWRSKNQAKEDARIAERRAKNASEGLPPRPPSGEGGQIVGPSLIRKA